MYNRTGGPVGPFLLCSHTKTKGGEGRLKGRGVHHRKGERGVGPVSMGPGRTQAGSSSGEGTLPGPRPGHSIDIPDTGSPVMHGWGEEEEGKGVMSTTRSHSPTNSDCSRA